MASMRLMHAQTDDLLKSFLAEGYEHAMPELDQSSVEPDVSQRKRPRYSFIDETGERFKHANTWSAVKHANTWSTGSALEGKHGESITTSVPSVGGSSGLEFSMLEDSQTSAASGLHFLPNLSAEMSLDDQIPEHSFMQEYSIASSLLPRITEVRAHGVGDAEASKLADQGAKVSWSAAAVQRARLATPERGSSSPRRLPKRSKPQRLLPDTPEPTPRSLEGSRTPKALEASVVNTRSGAVIGSHGGLARELGVELGMQNQVPLGRVLQTWPRMAGPGYERVWNSQGRMRQTGVNTIL